MPAMECDENVMMQDYTFTLVGDQLLAEPEVHNRSTKNKPLLLNDIVDGTLGGSCIVSEAVDKADKINNQLFVDIKSVLMETVTNLCRDMLSFNEEVAVKGTLEFILDKGKGFGISFDEDIVPFKVENSLEDPDLYDTEAFIDENKYEAETIDAHVAVISNTQVTDPSTSVAESEAHTISLEQQKNEIEDLYIADEETDDISSMDYNMSCDDNVSSSHSCLICGEYFADKSALQEHIPTHTDINRFRCAQCGKRFSEQCHLSTHMLSHENKFSCVLCTEIYSTSYELTQHMQTEHQMVKSQDKVVSCPECGKTFATQRSLVSHMKTHTGFKAFTCPVCDKKFSDQSSLIVHTRQHTNEKPYKCELCPKSFKQNSGLIEHRRVHTGEKPFECNLCGKRYKDASGLNHHLRIHSDKRPYKCLECGKSYIRQQVLNDHMRTHTGEKPHQCTTCGKGFTTKTALKDHLRIHTGEKPYVCPICKKAFTKVGHRTSHMKTHKVPEKADVGEKLYKCVLCDGVYAQAYDLSLHMKQHESSEGQSENIQVQHYTIIEEDEDVQCAVIDGMTEVQCAVIDGMSEVQCADIEGITEVQCADIEGITEVQCADIDGIPEVVQCAVVQDEVLELSGSVSDAKCEPQECTDVNGQAQNHDEPKYLMSDVVADNKPHYMIYNPLQDSTAFLTFHNNTEEEI